MSTLHYVGQELDLFSHAVNWKRYWAGKVRPYIRGDVLEVGAGLGVNTPLLQSEKTQSWTCLEPDPELAKRLENSQGARCKVVIGTTRIFEPKPNFDTIVYIDVIEHIGDDSGELEFAARLLRPGGSLIVLSPAHQWLYSAFDKSIGHVRRYNRRSLARCRPPSCRTEALKYLDSCGLIASAGNRLILKESMPSLKQIEFWDRFLVPCSSVVDRLTSFAIGKSILAIWKKKTERD